MNVKLKRLLLPLLRAVKEGQPISFRMRSAASQALYLAGKPKPKPTQKQRLRRGGLRATKNEETAKIRKACMGRAHSECEAKPWRGGGHGWPDVMDHWEGGSGRRLQRQSVETCWMLCVFCNDERTKNYPEAAYWNEIRRAHCAHYGYEFHPHVIHAELPRRAQP